jgi:hypothetical protein
MKFHIVQFSPASCHFITLRPKYSPEHRVLNHPQSVSDLKFSNIHLRFSLNVKTMFHKTHTEQAK